MTRPTSAERQAMRQRIAEATPEPWWVGGGGDCAWSVESHGFLAGILFEDEDPQDCEFVAHARQDMPRLLDALDEAEQEVARLKVLVAFVRGLVDEEQAIAATGMNRFALRVWRGDVGREGAALVQAAGEGRG